MTCTSSFCPVRALACHGGRVWERQPPQPTDGRIKGRTLRAGRSVVFARFFWRVSHIADLRRNVRRAFNILVCWVFRTLRSDAMVDDREFRIRPGRIRSTRAQAARPFIAQALAAAKKAGGGVSRSGRVTSGNRSRFGHGQRASIQANRPHHGALARRSRQGACRPALRPRRAARHASRLSAPRWRHPRRREGAAVWAGRGRGGWPRLRRALRGRPASFPLHRLARRRAGNVRPADPSPAIWSDRWRRISAPSSTGWPSITGTPNTRMSI